MQPNDNRSGEPGSRKMPKIEPITSVAANDDIVVSRGERIFDLGDASGGAPAAAVASAGADATITIERGGFVFSTEDGAVGIAAGGTNSTIEVDGAIVERGMGAQGASVVDGHIDVGGRIEVSGDALEIDGFPNSSAGIGLFGDSTAHIEQAGRIVASGVGSAGILSFSDDEIVNEGVIRAIGQDTVGLLGFGGQTFVNDGSIRATGEASQGIVLFGGAAVNNGTISTVGGNETTDPNFYGEGSPAIDSWAPGTSITNTGRLSSSESAGVEIRDFVGEGTTTIINEAGARIVGQVGIDGSPAVESVTNAGRINGDVLLKGGDDFYTATGKGSVVGEVSGGDGNDVLVGAGAKDVFSGGSGDDTLTGGGQSDTFIYSAGNDVITDFDLEDDLILLDGVSVEGASVDRIDGDLVLSFAEGNTLTLQGAADIEDALVTLFG